MTLTATQTTNTTLDENRRLTLRAFTALCQPELVDRTTVFAPQAEFLGPAQALWTDTSESNGRGDLADLSIEIESLEAEHDRVVTHATLRAGAGREARGLFVHTIADGRITTVSSLLRWS